MTVRFDAVIAGGGLSGLSLAARLAVSWADRRVLLIDDDTATPAAQCWAYWSAAANPAAPSADAAAAPVSASFDRVRVHAAGVPRTLPLGRYRYRLTRRSELRRAVLGLLATRPGFEVRSGRVEAVRDAPGGAETVVDGRVTHSDWAFDSVTRERAEDGSDTSPVDARLAFTGWEVSCPEPVFDPDTPTLFDFRTAQGGGSRFVYVLPTDPHRALIELTSFVPRHGAVPDRDTRAAALVTYLREVIGSADHRILRTEAAVLPLRSFPPPRRHGRVLAIGATGGLIKASTGYAYQRVRRDSAAIAASLARHGHPFAVPRRSRFFGALDAVLLEVLDRDPARLEEAFARLFAANPVERVLAFLDETSTPAETLRLIASLPPKPYVRAAIFRSARGLGWRLRRYGP